MTGQAIILVITLFTTPDSYTRPDGTRVEVAAPAWQSDRPSPIIDRYRRPDGTTVETAVPYWRQRVR